jgi:hypothetical protein
MLKIIMGTEENKNNKKDSQKIKWLEQLMLLSVGPTYFNKNENQKLKLSTPAENLFLFSFLFS